ncbi:MAG: hypothetical protein ACXAEL_14325, partial [Candidatus Hodarchaeales archaeon]
MNSDWIIIAMEPDDDSTKRVTLRYEIDLNQLVTATITTEAALREHIRQEKFLHDPEAFICSPSYQKAVQALLRGQIILVGHAQGRDDNRESWVHHLEQYIMRNGFGDLSHQDIAILKDCDGAIIADGDLGNFFILSMAKNVELETPLPIYLKCGGIEANIFLTETELMTHYGNVLAELPWTHIALRQLRQGKKILVREVTENVLEGTIDALITIAGLGDPSHLLAQGVDVIYQTPYYYYSLL